jgi:glycosyltransferase involved in cell wall biosynthesis
VATNVPGCRDVVVDGLTGLLVPPGDPTATAIALERLIRDQATRFRFGAEGRRHVEQNFSERRVVAEVLALYRTLLQSDADELENRNPSTQHGSAALH